MEPDYDTLMKDDTFGNDEIVTKRSYVAKYAVAKGDDGV